MRQVLGGTEREREREEERKEKRTDSKRVISVEEKIIGGQFNGIHDYSTLLFVFVD